MADLNAWAIIVPGVVTPTVVAGYALFQQRQSDRRSDIEELRRVLDDAAEALSDANAALLPLESSWKLGRGAIGDHINAATHSLLEVQYRYNRLVIRVGASAEVSQTYARAASTLRKYHALLICVLDDRLPFAGDVHGRSVEAIETGSHQFLEAARCLVALSKATR